MQKQRPQRNSTDFAVATAGLFSLVLSSVLLIARILQHREMLDLLCLLSGAASAFCYGKFIEEREKTWLGLAGLLLLACIFFFVKYIL
ncbi:hypothetical protein NRIC_04990 [Enterococcus florum]|uniref:Uncharacterized protein n=1 Tax=Enterococcus florum TaxID=2480627 RepID=A0A4P5P9G7_9ENTE|nr:hypothetical protein [Enterococcus florum]GCF92608.1 hypothetical protein NRIC_04990 [Enterococcus florum]